MKQCQYEPEKVAPRYEEPWHGNHGWCQCQTCREAVKEHRRMLDGLEEGME